ncbi:MAG: Ig-like domain-containing protein, partial [Burkholderiales bacterium]
MRSKSVLLLLTALEAACDASSEPAQPGSTVATIALSLPDVTMAVGGTVDLVAEVRDSTGNLLTDQQVIWSSSDTAKAEVDTAGTTYYAIVTSRSMGRGLVVARSGHVADTIAVEVTTVRFSSISVGDNHACGVTPSGAAFCWGPGYGGELGIGGSAKATAPV